MNGTYQPPKVSNVADIVFINSEFNPTGLAYRFINSEGIAICLTYQELAEEVAKLAYLIQSMTHPGDRVIIGARPGLEYVISFYACLKASTIAVPVFPPINRAMAERFSHILNDAEAHLAIFDKETLNKLNIVSLVGHFLPKTIKSRIGINQEMDKLLSYLNKHHIKLIASEERNHQLFSPDLNSLNREPTEVAFLQYTSGSTGHPKGVMVTHLNLLDNFELLRQAFHHRPGSQKFSWLPPYHDMGLVGGILEPLYANIPATLMSTIDFIINPIKWLSYMSEYRCTSTGAPNFAYDLCVKHAKNIDISTLDLSSIEVIVNGAEPINPSSVRQFYDTFKPAGLREGTIVPCFGLAEATVIVSSKQFLKPEKTITIDKTLFRSGKIVLSNHLDSRTLMSSGVPLMPLKIVNEQTHQECGDMQIGEVWITGGSVTKGYYNKIKETKQAFENRISNDSNNYLNTGDLGFIYENELFICGRKKDLIIIQGSNIYPQDVERAVESCHPAIRKGCTAVFSVEINQQEQLVIVAEIGRAYEKSEFQPIFEAIRKAAREEASVIPYSILLIKASQSLKTTSGKIRRKATKEAYLDNHINVLAKDNLLISSPIVIPAKESIEEMIIQLLKKVLVVNDIDKYINYNELGVTSLDLVFFQQQLQAYLGNRIEVSPELLVQYPTVAELTDYLYNYLAKDTAIPKESKISHSWKDVAIENRSQLARFDSYQEYQELQAQLAMLSNISESPIYLDINEGIASDTTKLEGKDKIHFSGYNYLGMSGDPRVTEACLNAIKTYGSSVSASRIASGDKPLHRQLEKAIADFIGTEDSVVMTAGFLTNASTISCLFGEHDVIFMDSLAHNSIAYGAAASRAKQYTFPHQNLAYLEHLLHEVRDQYQRVLIVIEGVYSADGDIPDLPALIDLKKRYDAFLMIDEAHSIGTIGKTGRGIGEYHHVNPKDVDIWMGTLSKTLASCGGYIAGGNELIKLLKYKSPGFVFSCGLSPANSAAALTAIELCIQEPWRVEKLQSNADYFRAQLKENSVDIGLSYDTPIVPIIIGQTESAILLCKLLREQGIYCHPMIYPSVEKNKARIRFFVNCMHSEDQLKYTAKIISDTLYKLK